MNIELEKMARRVGIDTVAATKALSHAMALTCRSFQDLVETSDEVGMPELGSGKEARRITAALEAMREARELQIIGRVSMLQKAQLLGMPDFGEGCLCGGSSGGGNGAAADGPTGKIAA